MHFPLSMISLALQVKQSPSPPPLQLAQPSAHSTHCAPSLKVLSGQGFPSLRTGLTGSHLVRSLMLTVYPDLQTLQVPVVSEHWVHPSGQAEQSPVEVRKKPAAQLAHLVPSLLSTQP